MIKTLNLKTLISLILLSLFGTILISSNTSATNYTLTLTSSGSQNINVTADADTAISADSINVATSCRYGYNFTINTSVNNNNLYLNGNSANNQSDTYFTPVNGIASLKNNPNSWGYYYNNANPTTTPTADDIFSPVPTLNNPATIKTPLASPSSTNINDSFNIYYGVSSSSSIPVGNYKMIPDANNSNNNGTIIYTATIADACMRYNVHFSPASYFEGNLITGTGTMNDQTIYEGVSTQLTANGFTAPSGYYFVGWNTAQDGSGITYTDQQSVTDLTTVGNTITLYAMWNDCPNGNICYFANVSNPNNVEGEMGNQEILETDTSARLYAPNYKRDGYGFISWNTKPDGTGANYGPQQTIEFAAGQYSTSRLKLYAKWLAPAGNMQNWSGCSSMSIGSVTALRDTRDNNVYAVAKLADSKCWMMENLRLDDSATLSSSNTNNPSLPLTNVYDTGVTSNHLSPNSSIAYNATTAPEGWCNTGSLVCDDQSRIRTDNTTLFVNNTASNYDPAGDVYSYGNYYNWYSATAGNGVHSIQTENTNVGGDICPKGWHLPTNGDTSNIPNSESAQLHITLGGNGDKSDSDTNPTGIVMSNTYRSYPINTVLSGIGTLPIRSRNSWGEYWSPTAYSNVYNAYISDIGISEVNVANVITGKYSGRTVRCISGT